MLTLRIKVVVPRRSCSQGGAGVNLSFLPDSAHHPFINIIIFSAHSSTATCCADNIYCLNNAVSGTTEPMARADREDQRVLQPLTRGMSFGINIRLCKEAMYQ